MEGELDVLSYDCTASETPAPHLHYPAPRRLTHLKLVSVQTLGFRVLHSIRAQLLSPSPTSVHH